MKKSLLSSVLLASLIISQSILAAPKGQVKGGACLTNNFTGGRAVFTCDHIGQNTISEIYEKGWRVVSFSQNLQFKNTVILVIEQQG